MKLWIASAQLVLVVVTAVLVPGCGGGGDGGGSAATGTGLGGTGGVAGTGGLADSGGVADGGGSMGGTGSSGGTGGGVADGGGTAGGGATGSGTAGGQGDPGTLIGHTISTTSFHGIAPDQTMISGPVDVLAGDGVELTNRFSAGFATIDFAATSILVTAAADQPFGYLEVLRFDDTHGAISAIASVTADPSTNYAGFNASRLAITADSIDLNLTALNGRQGQKILLNITFAP